ncbi:MAG: M1 family peptidase, partial [Polaribacter sp.]
TTHTIDYGVKSVDGKTITLERIGKMPMPIDVEVTYTDDTKENYTIPLRVMRGAKPTNAKILEDWAWAFPTYTFKTAKSVKFLVIDKSGLMADVKLDNNTYSVE